MTYQTSPIDLMVSLKIAEYYPNKYAFMAVQDPDTKMWSACISALENGLVSFTLYNMDLYIYLTAKEAVNTLSHMVEISQRAVLTMSN